MTSTPYFTDTNINFTEYPFVPKENLFVSPKLVLKFMFEFIKSFESISVTIFDKQLTGYLVADFPTSFYEMNEIDAMKTEQILNHVTMDYLPKIIFDEFSGMLSDSTLKGHLLYDLKRYEQWVEKLSGRNFKQEILYRFGIKKNDFITILAQELNEEDKT